MKKFKITFWTITSIIVLFDGLLPILTLRAPMAIAGITHLGYPVYFVTLLAIFKALGAIALIVPQVPARVKEWAYAGFGIDFISAAISIAVVDGIGGGIVLPIIFIGLLIASYISYHRMQEVVITK